MPAIKQKRKLIQKKKKNQKFSPDAQARNVETKTKPKRKASNRRKRNIGRS
jgi:hypothetical protein